MVDTQGAVPDSSDRRFVSNRPWCYERRMVFDTALLMLWPPALGQIVQERSSRVLVGTTPRVSTFCLPDVTARDQISQAFPLRICIL